MNVLRIGLVLLTGVGFSFGVDRLVDSEALPNDRESHYTYNYEGNCHGDNDFLEHMLDDLSNEELLLVQEKIDSLLVKYSITLEELYDDYGVRYDFMSELMDFLDENYIDYHNHEEFDDHFDENEWHGGMGMH
ncbi:hypothetical protein RJI07_04925 [Mycoplasmatota bacterium WC30]